MNTFSRADLDEIQKVAEHALGVKMEIVELPWNPDITKGVQFGFHFTDKVTVPYEDSKEGQKRFTILLSKLRDGICDQFKKGSMWKSLVEDHQKEVKAFEAIIEEKDKEIEELKKFKHHFEIEQLKKQPTERPDGKVQING